MSVNLYSVECTDHGSTWAGSTSTHLCKLDLQHHSVCSHPCLLSPANPHTAVMTLISTSRSVSAFSKSNTVKSCYMHVVFVTFFKKAHCNYAFCLTVLFMSLLLFCSYTSLFVLLPVPFSLPLTFFFSLLPVLCDT